MPAVIPSSVSDELAALDCECHAVERALQSRTDGDITFDRGRAAREAHESGAVYVDEFDDGAWLRFQVEDAILLGQRECPREAIVAYLEMLLRAVKGKVTT